MTGQILQLVPYFAAAVMALVLNWRSPLFVSGSALVAFSLLSGLAYFTMPFGAVVVTEIVLAMLMAIISSVLWAEGMSSGTHRAVMGLALLDTAWCGLTCWRNDTSPEAQTLFGNGANVLFLGMCAAVAAPGAIDVVRAWLRPVSSLRSDDHAPASKEGQ